jgi:hypothetical protein
MIQDLDPVSVGLTVDLDPVSNLDFLVDLNPVDLDVLGDLNLTDAHFQLPMFTH